VLDEVQRAPELFTSLKAEVDSRREPGRFILTGSANVLLVPRLVDSLAGRMEILRLHPLSQAELAGEESSFLSMLFKTAFRAGPSGQRLGMALAERVAAGGYPVALARATPRRRMAWYLWKNRAVFGRLLETFIYQELRRHASWQEETIIFSHFRDKDKVEIDVVLESGGRVAGVEVKAAATVTSDDFKGLRKLQDAVQERFAAGVVLYDGGSVVPFGRNLYAVPISCLWQTN
jgi:predicted AAA+ superfamily ATPase